MDSPGLSHWDRKLRKVVPLRFGKIVPVTEEMTDIGFVEPERLVPPELKNPLQEAANSGRRQIRMSCRKGLQIAPVFEVTVVHGAARFFSVSREPATDCAS
jgi:hypothetical protein